MRIAFLLPLLLVMEGARMAGAILLGDIRLSARVKKIVEDRLDIADTGSNQELLDFLEKV